ncbi:unnamed protein product [Candidula unifasciata]|uniref:Uncharacterized protein n=1 Tax=Candidula unifasciata TaxID=100452 RepID=A0A8S4A7N1_9EUPU|nr:unnamed protein product [Candidula unifasciata]
MSSLNTAAVGFLAVPAKLPKEWQPKLNEWNPYHCSHPDVARAGWRKWSAEQPGWQAWKASSRHPDWYNREVNYIVQANNKNKNWHWEQPSKPTSRQYASIPGDNEPTLKVGQKLFPHNRGYHGNLSYPQPFPQEVPTPKWGLYHPGHYQEPTRLNHFPPIHHEGYQKRDQ